MKKLVLTTGLILAGLSAFPQLTINNTFTPQQLVQNYLVGSGVTVTNVTLNGAPGTSVSPQVAHFNSSAANVGINQGLILASGNASNAIGPNDESGVTTALGGQTFDPDLMAISGLNIYDQAVLEFDFIPAGDTIEFRYVFASDEYMEFVGGGINDAFGIFISGPGISGPFSNNAVNMAVIPGTSTYVTIDNVNLFTNGAYYLDNGDGFAPPYSTNPFYIQYDGKTVVLTSKYPVQCGQTYHIKFAISDGFDSMLDSGVFIEAGSFSSTGVSVSLDVPVFPNTPAGSVYEGCDLTPIVDFLFTRPDTIANDTVYFQVGGNAINGTDYSAISNNYIVFGPGQDSATLSISITDDGIVEGTDTLTISIITYTSCGATIQAPSFLYIMDPYIVEPFAGNDTVYYCIGDVLNFNGLVLTGIPPYTYNWSNGVTGVATSLTVTQLGNDSLVLEVSDGCGYYGSDTVFISQAPLPALVADAGPDVTVSCPGQTVTLDGSYFHDLVSTSYNWNGNVFDSILVIQPLVTSEYIFNVTNTCGQSASDTLTVFVPPYTPLSLFVSDSLLAGTCPGDPVTVSAYAIGGTAPYSYMWSNGDNDSVTTTLLISGGTIQVTATDFCGLDTTVSLDLGINLLPIDLEVRGGRHCRNADSTAIIPYTLSGGQGPYTFTFSSSVVSGSITADTVAEVITISYPESGVYYTTVTDGCGSTASDSASISMIDCAIVIPNVISPNGDAVNDVFFIDGLNLHPNSSLLVYNRWGVLVYSDADYQNNWNGGGLPAGVYYYIVELTDGTVPSTYFGFLHIYY